MSDIVILPGIGGSGEAHWQTRWQSADPRLRRFKPKDWRRPDLADWIAALDGAVRDAPSPPILVAHSLACLLVAHWQAASALPVAGALLVAVPDPRSPAFPAEAASFAAPPGGPLRFASLVVASTDDPYGRLDYARACATTWGSGLVEVGAAGHINGQSGLGAWPEGLMLLKAFAAGTGSPHVV